MTSVTTLPFTLLSPDPFWTPPGQSLASLVPAPGALGSSQGASAPSFEELMARQEALDGSPNSAKPTFAFSELGIFGLSGAVAFRNTSTDPEMSAAANNPAAPEPSPQPAGPAAETPASTPGPATLGTAPPGTSNATALRIATSESALAGSPQPATTAGALAAKGVQAAATADDVPSLASVFEAVTDVGSAGQTSAETAPMEAPGHGAAPSEFATPSQRQASAPQTDASPNTDLNLVVSESDGEAQVAVAAPALSPEAQTRLRQVADAVAADFGLTLTKLSFNGAALERVSTITGA
jgi:hypothetical protein